MRKHWIPTLVATVAICVSSSTFAASIGLNFTGGRSGGGGAGGGGTDGELMLAGDLAGVVEQQNWNNGVGANGNQALVDDSGAASGATATWSGVPNSWTVSSNTAADGNERLMNGYLDTNNSAGQTTVAVTDLAFKRYSVIVYKDGDSNSGRSGDYTVNGVTQTDLREAVNFPIGAPAGDGVFNQATTGNAGNFALFENVYGKNLTVVADESASGGGFRAPVNGIQIVEESVTGISLNFANSAAGNAANGTFNVTGPAGVVAFDNWNNGISDGGGDGNLANLVDAKGTATGTSVTWTSANTWGTPQNADDGGDGSLMRAYLDSNNQGFGGGVTMDITGLAGEFADGYDLIVYFDGDGTGRFGDYRVDEGIDGSFEQLLTGNDDANGLGEFVQDFGLSTTSGNFLVFRDLTALNLRLESGATDGFRAPISGIQLIRATTVPEPTTALLGLLGLAGMGIRRRRRAA